VQPVGGLKGEPLHEISLLGVWLMPSIPTKARKATASPSREHQQRPAEKAA